MTKNKQHKKPYVDWLKNPVAINNVKELIQEVGFPLEFTTRKEFRNNGYDVSNSYYSQLDYKPDLLREIDIYATKTIEKVIHEGCEFIFNLVVVGECKYSSTNDFFGFPSENQTIGSSFPVIYGGNNLLEVDLDANFSFPTIIQNISEIDTTALNIFTDNKVVYGASEQILDALSFFADIRSSQERSAGYLKICEKIKPKFESYQKEKGTIAILSDEGTLHYDKKTIKDFFNSMFEKNELFKMIESFTINITIPLVVIATNNGLIRVDIENEKIHDLVEMKYCVYLYAPKEIKPSSRPLIRDSNFAVILCNAHHLQHCLCTIENGIRKSIPQIMLEIKNKPYLLCHEIFTNSYIATKRPG